MKPADSTVLEKTVKQGKRNKEENKTAASQRQKPDRSRNPPEAEIRQKQKPARSRNPPEAETCQEQNPARNKKTPGETGAFSLKKEREKIKIF